MLTTADKKRDAAKDCIGEAIKRLSEIVVEGADGFEEYNSEYRNKLRIALAKLLEALASF